MHRAAVLVTLGRCCPAWPSRLSAQRNRVRRVVFALQGEFDSRLGLAVEPDIGVAALAVSAFAKRHNALIQASVEREATLEEASHL
jgi:hypothetical protein